MRTVLSIAIACSGLAVSAATAAPIIPTGGDSFLLAYGDGGPPVFEFRSTFGPLGGQNPLPFNVPAGSSSVAFASGSLTSSASFAHTASSAGITIAGSTFADAPNAGNVVAQGSPDSDGIISTEFGFGYSVQFTQTADGFVRIDVAGVTDALGAGGFADFGVLLLDPAANELYQFGGPNGGTDSALVFLPAGVYYFYAQSQSAALGDGPSSASAAFSASLTAIEAIPEPISLAVFGGLIVGGGLVARKRLAGKTTAAV